MIMKYNNVNNIKINYIKSLVLT